MIQKPLKRNTSSLNARRQGVDGTQVAAPLKSQVRPASQTLGKQHASPLWPHSAAHKVRALQIISPSQGVSLGQHVSPDPPQATQFELFEEGSQKLPSSQTPGVPMGSTQQTSPGLPQYSQKSLQLHGTLSLQENSSLSKFSQHMFLSWPHVASGSQVNPTPPQLTSNAQLSLQQNPLVALQNPLWQSPGAEQSAPLARLATHIPPLQEAPLSQTSLAQHVCPTAPQAGPAHVKPSPVQATPFAQSSLQQIPLTALQNPLWQSSFPVHDWPLATALAQTPPVQRAPATQSPLLAQVVRQVVPLQT